MDPVPKSSLNEFNMSNPFLCWVTLKIGCIFTPYLKFLCTVTETEIDPSPSTNPPKK